MPAVPVFDSPLEPLLERLRQSPARRVVVARRHRGLRDSDVFLASFPRSGNTWTKFMLAELLGGSRVDYKTVEHAIPMLGAHDGAPALLPGEGRVIKTHEAYRSEYRRSIYIVRDVRDVAPSVRRMREIKGIDPPPLKEFLEAFVAGKTTGYGTWEDHIASWLEAQERGAEVLFVRYETLIDETASQLRRIVDFLRLDISDERIAEVIASNRSSEMAKKDGGYDPALVAIAQKNATYGSWKKTYTEEELSILGPTAPMMRRLGYDVTDQLTDRT